jgi:hypothetical protein
MDLESRSPHRPSQSRGFQAKPGRQNTILLYPLLSHLSHLTLTGSPLELNNVVFLLSGAHSLPVTTLSVPLAPRPELHFALAMLVKMPCPRMCSPGFVRSVPAVSPVCDEQCTRIMRRTRYTASLYSPLIGSAQVWTTSVSFSVFLFSFSPVWRTLQCLSVIIFFATEGEKER